MEDETLADDVLCTGEDVVILQNSRIDLRADAAKDISCDR